MLALRHPIRFLMHLKRLRSASLALWILAYENAERANGRRN